MTHLTLIRHAEANPDWNLPEPEWRLTAAGEAQAAALSSKLTVARIYSSPFRRAVATVTPLAQALGLEIEQVEDLRERTLAEGRLENWREALQRTWLDFDYRLPGGETSRECQNRVVGALTRIAREADGAHIAASSHGNAIALFLNSLDADFGFDAWAAMSNPQLFELTWDGERWTLV